jgi:hypothetical protein
MLRSTLHGFTTFETGGGFQLDVDVDESFAWTIAFMDRGLQASARNVPTSTGGVPHGR